MKRRDPEDTTGNYEHFDRYYDRQVTIVPTGATGRLVGYAADPDVAADTPFPDMLPNTAGPRWHIVLADGSSEWWPPPKLNLRKGGAS